LVFGAKRLPEIGRSLGSGMREFKDSVSGESEKASLTAASEQPPAPAPAPAQAPAQAPAAQTPPAAQPVPASAPAPAPAEPQHQA
jgi:sec-independent protein translocase protein TatA